MDPSMIPTLEPTLAIAPAVAAALISAFGGLFGSAISANQRSRQEQAARNAAAAQRARAMDLINRIRDVNYADVDMAGSQAYTQARNATAANMAQRGLRGGAVNAAQNSVLAQTLGNLAQFKAQDQRAREQMVANILNDPAFDMSAERVDVLGNTLLGGLAGGAGAAGQAGSAILGSPEVLAAIQSGGKVQIEGGDGGAQNFQQQTPGGSPLGHTMGAGTGLGAGTYTRGPGSYGIAAPPSAGVGYQGGMPGVTSGGSGVGTGAATRALIQQPRAGNTRITE